MKKIIFAFIACLMLTCSQLATAQLSEEVKRKTPELPGQIVADFGFNLVTNNPERIPYHWWRSKSLGLYFVKSFDFMKKFELRPGVGVNLEKFGHNSNMDVFTYLESTTGTDSLAYSTVAGGSLKKNQLAVNYIEFPVEVRFNFNGNDKKDGLFIAAGGSAAFRIESHTKLKYSDEFGKKMKVKQKNDFGLNTVRLGAYGRIGYRSFSLFYKTYFTGLFSNSGPQDDPNFVNQSWDLRYSTIGISLSGL